MSFSFLEHTADVQVECRADSLAGLLESAARALYAVTLREVQSVSDHERVVEVRAANREEMLIRWLQELNYLLDIEHFVGTQFVFESIKDGGACVRLRGYRCSAAERAEEVKSATYHELAIQQNDGGFMARVIFDL